MPVRFVAVGELLVDVVAEGAGHDARIRVRPAGSAFNAAVAAVAAGADATVIGTVGDDPGGRMILAELAERGVHAEVTVSEGPTGTFLLADGEIRVDRGVAHDLVLPERIEADAMLVSGTCPPRARRSPPREADLVALDAARLGELPPGGNVVVSTRDVPTPTTPPAGSPRAGGSQSSRSARAARSRCWASVSSASSHRPRRRRARRRRRLRGHAPRLAGPRRRPPGRARSRGQAALDSLA